MSPYRAITDFWHNGILISEGEIVHLADNAVKYLAHAVEEVQKKIEAKQVEIKDRLDKAVNLKVETKTEAATDGGK